MTGKVQLISRLPTVRVPKFPPYRPDWDENNIIITSTGVSFTSRTVREKHSLINAKSRAQVIKARAARNVLSLSDGIGYRKGIDEKV